MASRRSNQAATRGIEVSGIGRKLGLMFLLFIWIFMLASLIGFDPGDPPSHVKWPANSPVHNWCGAFGAAMSYWCWRCC